jgi:hypothetical protein
MKSKQLEVAFPLAGLNRKAAYRQQKPYSTTDCLNVRPVDTIARRERGGSRPGLMQSHIDDLGSDIRLLTQMTLAPGDKFTSYSDTFGGLSMSSAWTAASWPTTPTLPVILSSVPAASISTSVLESAAVLSALTIDTAQAYTVEMLVVPWAGAFHGSYRLYFRLDNTTPALGTAGNMVELTITGTTGAYAITLSNSNTVVHTATGTLSSIRPGWLSATVSGNNVVVYWCGTEVIASHAITAASGTRVGFGLKCTVAGGLCLANTFRVQYYSTGEVNTLRSMLIASSGGNIYRETPYGRMALVSSALTLNDSVALCAAQEGQDLYIADYGDMVASGTDGSVSGTTFDDTAATNWVTAGVDADDMVVVVSAVQGTAVAGTYKIQTVAAGTITLTGTAGTGACSYRIERAPKIYDPLSGTITIATATTGQFPTGNPLTCRYMDRIVVAGASIAPHVWYMSRQGDPLDWDYSQEDEQAAVAGTSSAAGVPGEAITALVPHSDDYLLMGCRNSLWRLRGDPASGGQLDALSHSIGIIGPRAWCIVPSGEVVFLSLDGLYAVEAGGDTFPVSLSRDTLPRELQNLNPDMLTISLEYDLQGQGIHIFLTPVSSNTCIHWWLDWNRKSFWPLTLTANHEPMSTCVLQATAIEDSGVILGGRDGILRRYSDLAEDDCGTVFSSYAICGPIALNADMSIGRLLSLDAILADTSGPITWNATGALTFEGASSGAATSSGNWVAGINASVYTDCRGQAFTVKLSGTPGRKWAFEQATATILAGGKRRIP